MAEEKKGFFKGFIDKMAGTIYPALPDSSPMDEPKEEQRPGFFERLKSGLSKTHENLVGRIDTLLLGKKRIDADTLEELEEILIMADIGVSTAVELVRTLEQRLKRNELQDADTRKSALKEEILARLSKHCVPLDTGLHAPFVIMVIGVNGVGKTN